jgi:hypothetical protein
MVPELALHWAHYLANFGCKGSFFKGLYHLPPAKPAQFTAVYSAAGISGMLLGQLSKIAASI